MKINEPDDGIFADKLGAALREAELDVDPHTLESLAAARRQAVKAAESRKPLWSAPISWALTGTVAAAVLTIAVFLSSGEGRDFPPLGQPEFAAAQDAELLEELEFVAWMLAMEDSDESSTSG